MHTVVVLLGLAGRRQAERVPRHDERAVFFYRCVLRDVLPEGTLGLGPAVELVEFLLERQGAAAELHVSVRAEVEGVGRRRLLHGHESSPLDQRSEQPVFGERHGVQVGRRRLFAEHVRHDVSCEGHHIKDVPRRRDERAARFQHA